MLNVDYVKILNTDSVDINVAVSASVVCAVVCDLSCLDLSCPLVAVRSKTKTESEEQEF